MEGSAIFVLMIAFFILICWCVFWGCVTDKIVENKGYDENWFWWGFFFGLIAFIIACTKPECHNFYDAGTTYLSALSREREAAGEVSMINNDGWKCKKCKKVNASYVGTCACGNTKTANNQAGEIAKPQPVIKKPIDNTVEENDNFQLVRQYKQLLDEGIISHEEYEKKRKELLEL